MRRKQYANVILSFMSQNFRVVCSEVPDLDVKQIEEPPVPTIYIFNNLIVNPLLHMLYLEHCIISINNSNFQIISKKYFLHFKSFENIMENGIVFS